ncbi:hypothetical protein ACTJKK_16475 [Microbacterium sp. 22179]|uniref:hypothetical protein n=1 Tax=Microbacterium sp. 22179 TaxID=3453886 RepID=UPI003F87DCD2
MPRWRWFLVQGVLLLAAGVLFGLALVVGSAGVWVGVAALVSLVVASVALFLGWRERWRMLDEEARSRRRRGA